MPTGGREWICSCSGPASRPECRFATTIPREVGPDRIANAVGARERHGAPCIVVDFGTSTNFDVVSAAGEFAGGVLAPGVQVSMDALFSRAARLPKVPFVAPERVISQTTVSALQSGLVYGFAGQVDAIVDRIREELGALEAPVVATGGLAELIAPHSRTITAVDPELTLQGLRIVGSGTAERPTPPVSELTPSGPREPGVRSTRRVAAASVHGLFGRTRPETKRPTQGGEANPPPSMPILRGSRADVCTNFETISPRARRGSPASALAVSGAATSSPVAAQPPP